MPPELAAGTSLYAYEHQWRGFQQYLTATVDAWEADLQTSNNSVGWTSNGAIAMDALFLTPGSQANVWFYAFRDVPGVSIESSDPSVVSVPAGMTLPNERKPLSFVARGSPIRPPHRSRENVQQVT
jgi:hypothetical protein